MINKITGIPLYIIVLINLVLKLGMYCYISPWDKTVESTKIVTSDSRGYQDVAENILHYGTFAPLKDTINLNSFSAYRATGYVMRHPDCWMMPVYPVYLAGIYSITGIKPFIAILIQLFLSLISVVLVYRICRLLFENSKVATIATLLFALDIHSIYVANLMLTETLFVLLFLAGVYYFLKGMKEGKLPVLCLGIFFLGLASLTRLVALMYPGVLILILLFSSKQKRVWKLKAVTLFLALFSLMNATWVMRNHSCYGHWQITAHGGWSLLMYNASLTKSRITHENVDSAKVSFQKQADSMGFRKMNDIFEQSDMYKKIATDYISQHKGIYLLTHLQGCVNMFLSLGNMGMANTFGWAKAGPTESFAEFNITRIIRNFSVSKRETLLGILILLILAIQYLGAFYGIIKLFKVRNFMVVSLVILTAGYFAGITGAFGAYRFKLPVVPFICVAAGYGYANFKRKKTEADSEKSPIDK